MLRLGCSLARFSLLILWIVARASALPLHASSGRTQRRRAYGAPIPVCQLRHAGLFRRLVVSRILSFSSTKVNRLRRPRRVLSLGVDRPCGAPILVRRSRCCRDILPRS